MHSIDDFFKYLRELSAKLEAEHQHATILLFGGGALSMRYGARDSTKDLDVAFQDATKEAILRHSLAISNEHNAENDWINDEGAGSLTKEILDSATVFLELPALTILTPSAEALLAMKVCSFRLDDQHQDVNDIRFLISKLGIKTTDEVFAIVDKYRPDYVRYLTPKHQYVLEEYLNESSQDNA